jgi:hypothetical protein
MTSVLIQQHFQYISKYYYCQISYYDLPGLLIAGCFVYYVPMFGIGLIYFNIICYTKSSTIKSTRSDCSSSYYYFNWNTFSSFFSFCSTLDKLFYNWLSISIHLSFSMVNIRFLSINSTGNISIFNTLFANLTNL